MKRPDDLYLVDIVESSDDIASFIQGFNRDQFLASRRDQSAVLWKLMVIGEACTSMDPVFKSRFNEIPWKQIKGLRNRLAHGYFSLDWSEIWRIATDEVPILRDQAVKIMLTDYPDTFRRMNEEKHS